MKIINQSLFSEENISKMAKEFSDAKPYKHLVIDNFLQAEMADKIFNEFPKEEVFNKRYKGVNEFKAEGSNFEDFSEPIFYDNAKRKIL